MRLLLSSLALLLAVPAFAAKVDYESNLSQIPAADPATPDAPALLPAMKGIHPRLLFTAQDVAKMKANVAASPLLKQTADKIIADSKRYRAPKENPLPMVMNDTPALAQASGQWPSLAYAYALEPNPQTLEAISNVLSRMLEQPYWADTVELDANMGAACNMFAVAVLFDAAYADLNPQFRRQVAERLLVQSRRMFYLGHKQLAKGVVKYWQQDPAPNHRWYRLRGLAAAVLAIADEPGLDTAYLRKELKAEAEFIMKWYPEEGDCHEGSGYQQFGLRSLYDAAVILDNGFGTKMARHPGFAATWKQQLYYWVPADNSLVSFGDAQNATLRFHYDDAPFFAGPRLSRDANAQAALQRRMELMMVPGADGRPVLPPWTLLAYYDPTLTGGDYRAIPTTHLFPDLGAASFRDSWEKDAVIFTFKCGPYGGQALNAYRHAYADDKGKPHYVNVAHDDPDANAFSLTVGADKIFHPGVYSTHKLTRDNNTLTIGTEGQIMDDDEWTQPVADGDMRELSYLTGWKQDAQGRAIIEGETGPAYRGKLDRFRRTAVWLPGDYILLLDDVRPTAAAKEPLTWRGLIPDGRFVKAEEGRAKVVAASGREVPLQFLADRPVNAALDDWFVGGRWGHLLARQFQFSLAPEPVRFAVLIDPWKRGVSLATKPDGDALLLAVTGPAGTDLWKWSPATDAKTPSALAGVRNGRPLIALTSADKAPAAHVADHR
ncbi:hypothetical protein [Rariglobus hedericola]|uniref:DUF4962 domain-containing protein n=1 Tax=Rariglobus hedericola TaxID=2597822 RepID=A0A556QP49_9BACT|nr:hypothetical protein [Rariglobus hedericola]TSJ78415.1 hypothetical protein FPL22_03710 [Rariglobus hedericola]